MSTPAYTISTDRSRLDRELIHRFLSQDAYWSPGVSRDVVERSIDNSLCFGVYADQRQVGFARAVTDGATFAWIADVFVLPPHRGQGLGKRLVEAILSHPQVNGVRRCMLATADAHDLYRRYGFAQLEGVQRFMAIEDPTARDNCEGALKPRQRAASVRPDG